MDMSKLIYAMATFLICINMPPVHAAPENPSLSNYLTIKQALLTGHRVSVVTDFSKCQGNYPANAIGGTQIDQFLIY
ncbi:hypothetical protein F518_02649 [Serratia marcescens VGH107]|nr:hypothetical protein F518_02649 [Serratia marcescens VGH107]